MGRADADSSLAARPVYIHYDLRVVTLADEEKPTPQEGEYAELARRLARGDQTAFRTLFDEMMPRLLRLADRITGSHAQAKDLVQDAFLKLWEERQSVDPDRNVKAYLYAIVRTRALNAVRDHRYGSGMDPGDLTGDDRDRPDRVMDANTLGACFTQCFNQLPAKRRQAFELSRFEGLAHREIAEIMNLSPRTVNTHLTLALRNLRECIGECTGSQV